jgi:putative Holliday junction resolvase
MISGPGGADAPLPAGGKLMALDVGLARIGVAVCDPLRLASRPVTTLRRTSRRDDFAQLARLVEREEIVAVVCGLPLNMDGSVGDQARTTRKWAMRLAQALRAILGRPVPVVFWDERLTSFAAQELQAEQGLEASEDAIAAAIILQSYLDALRRGETTDWGRIVLPAKAE